MSEPKDTITRTDEAEAVDVVEGPVGSATLKEPSEVEGSVAPVDRDDLQVDIGDTTTDGGGPTTTPR